MRHVSLQSGRFSVRSLWFERGFEMRRMLPHGMLALCVCVLLTGCGPDAATEYELSCRQDIDSVYPDVEDGKDSVVFHVNSETGVGGVRIEPANGCWPEKVVVRLNLREIDSLTVSNGPTKVTARKPDGPMIYHVVGERPCRLRGENSPLCLKIRRTGRGIDVTIPPVMYGAEHPYVELGWVSSAGVMEPTGPSSIADAAERFNNRP